jgi:hypothetical protein
MRRVACLCWWMTVLLSCTSARAFSFVVPCVRSSSQRTLHRSSQLVANRLRAGRRKLAGQGSDSGLTEDAPDVAGQTIGHWSEETGCIRWALVEPDLAALQAERRNLEAACERVEQRLQQCSRAGLEEEVVAFARADLDVSGNLSFEEWRRAFGDDGVDDAALRRLFDAADEDRNGTLSLGEFLQDRLRKQKAALTMQSKVLQDRIDQYQPQEHAPECIAEGGQGMILVGKDLATGEKVAIKVERVQEGRDSSLTREFNVLRSLQNDPCFPNVLHFGRQMLNSNPSSTDCRVMVMDLLGESVSDLWFATTRGSRGFNAATALALAVRMLDLLQRLHDKGFIHRDVKPANFVMSGEAGDAGKGRGHLCLVDFGLAVPAAEESARHTIQQQQASSTLPLAPKLFFGTRLYASSNAHEGGAQSFSDDVEALAYVLAFLLHGALPWDDSRLSLQEVASFKARTAACLLAREEEEEEALLGTLAPKDAKRVRVFVRCVRGAGGVCELLEHARTLAFGEQADYSRCRSVLVTAYEKQTGGAQYEQHVEEWNAPKREERQKMALDFLDLI